MHTLSTTRAPYCALERPTSTKDISISLLSSSSSSSPKYFKSSSMSATEIFEKEENRHFVFYFKILPDIFMQINVCFAAMADCSNAFLIQLHSVHESFFSPPCASLKTQWKLDLFSETSSCAQELSFRNGVNRKRAV